MNELKRIREEKNLSRKALEKMTGIRARTIASWESGQVDLANAEFVHVVKLAKALEVDMMDLFGEIGGRELWTK